MSSTSTSLYIGMLLNKCIQNNNKTHLIQMYLHIKGPSLLHCQRCTASLIELKERLALNISHQKFDVSLKRGSSCLEGKLFYWSFRQQTGKTMQQLCFRTMQFWGKCSSVLVRKYHKSQHIEKEYINTLMWETVFPPY